MYPSLRYIQDTFRIHLRYNVSEPSDTRHTRYTHDTCRIHSGYIRIRISSPTCAGAWPWMRAGTPPRAPPYAPWQVPWLEGAGADPLLHKHDMGGLIGALLSMMASIHSPKPPRHVSRMYPACIPHVFCMDPECISIVS